MHPIVVQQSDSHWYTQDGNPQHGATLREARKQNLLPSVTTVIKVLAKPQLERWKIENAILASVTLPRLTGESVDEFAKRAASDFEQSTKMAAEFGRKVHDSCEAYNLFGKIAVEDDGIRPYLEKYTAWHREHVDKVIAAEKVVLHVDHGYAGRIDLCFKHKNGKVYMADIKTQKYSKKPQFYESWGMQLSAYSRAQNLPVKIDAMGSIVINSGEPSDAVWHEWEDERGYYENFIRCLQIWQWQKKYKPEKK